MSVLAVDLRPDDDHGPGAAFEADLTEPDANARAVAAALDRFGRLDVVVPNAGVQHVSADRSSCPDERWQTIVGLLLSSPFYLAKHALAGPARGGRRPVHRHRIGPRPRRLAVQGR